MIGRVRESRNPKKVIRVSLRESYGEIRRVPVNLSINYHVINLLKNLDDETQIPQAGDRSGPDQNDQCFGGQIGHVGYCFLDKLLMNIIHLNTTTPRNKKGQLTNHGN